MRGRGKGARGNVWGGGGGLNIFFRGRNAHQGMGGFRKAGFQIADLSSNPTSQ